ncbi:MAG: branched-chain amino acid ABC transporter permease [Acidimicrobiia bacterium]|jgi:branched-chain amino acid transport system permease protein|nr:branched-chain amino acid ABC transporter permease [Acidimicrobiia bacterium]MBA3982734.1 branched-chain amino acid ABC transporter permease [Acidimicrobiia bacterium]MDQ3392033.1 branched-chain amino acid ABC transporter permease [Actinomycetota bacterium]
MTAVTATEVSDEERGNSQMRPAGGGRFRPSPIGWLARAVIWAGVAYLVLVVPLGQSPTDVQQFTRGVCYAVVALSLNVMLGYVGQISLGHQAFVGVGAFTSAYMVTTQGQSFWMAVFVAAAVGGAQALVLGAVSLRIRGLYFALITLSYGLVAQDNIFEIQELTGGGAGQQAPKPQWFETEWRYYYLCLAFLAIVLYVDWRMMRTKSGRALLALRENPRVASTFGINVRLATLFAFVVSGVFAGLAGALIAHNDTQVSVDVWNFNLALVFVIMTVVGGLRSRWGLVIGGAFFALLPYLIEKIPGFDELLADIPWVPRVLTPEIAPLVIGPLLLLINLIQFPGGIGQQLRPITRWLGGHRFDIHDKGPKEVQITDVRA